MLKKLLTGAVLLAALFVSNARATDNPIFPTGPVFALNSLVWGQSGPNGFNNNFFFVPQNLNESVCAYVYNNNTTNPHPFTISITITANPNNSTPSDGTWQQAATNTATAVTSPGQPAGLSTVISGVAKANIALSGSGALGGSPDTANLIIIQTSGPCFSGAGSPSSSATPVSANPGIQTISEGLSSAAYGNASVVNPAANAVILSIQNTSGPRSLYFYKAYLTATAADVLNITGTTTTGTCTAATVVNLKVAGPGLAATANSPCTVSPTAISATQLQISIPANTTVVVDLSGFVAPNGTVSGLMVTSAAQGAATVTAAIQWYEK